MGMAGGNKKDGQWDCRLWWPNHLSLAHPAGPLALIGWASFSATCSLDLVVATACPMPSSLSLQALEKALNLAGERLRSQILPAMLQAPSILGEYFPVCSCKEGYEIRNDWSQAVPKGHDGIVALRGQNGSASSHMQGFKWGATMWAAVMACKVQDGGYLPRLTYVMVKGIQFQANTHVVLYEQPQYGRGHLSCRMWSSAHLAKQECKRATAKPGWVNALAEQQSAPNIEVVIQQLNCSAFVGHTVASGLGLSSAKANPLYILWRHTTAALVASVATILYIVAWACSSLLDKWLCAVPYIGCVQQRSHTWQALHLRCHQLLAWPFILLWGGVGSEQANVAMAHRCAQSRHTTWTAIVVDMVMGAMAGVMVLRHKVTIAQSVHRMVQMLTNDIMRTGCIWLMGVPAGFKLNDELATWLGTLALHVIQTWATVGALVKPALRFFLPVLGLFGISMGLTVPVAILVDTLLLGSIHVAALHQATASLYASQLRALAALWRLFRAKKRNPLRGRQDTYEYTVEQLVVGSLMFAPLLLLLPTTSVFYTFFTLVYSILSILRLCLQYVILILQWFPYAEVALWLAQSKQFPSGIWFKAIYASQDNYLGSSFVSLGNPIHAGSYSGSNGPRIPWNQLHTDQNASLADGNEFGQMQGVKTTLVSVLGVETASLGELLSPFAEQLGGVCTLRSAVALIYKSVSGGRIPLALELEKGAKLPHTPVRVRTFWRLCYLAVFLAQ